MFFFRGVFLCVCVFFFFQKGGVFFQPSDPNSVEICTATPDKTPGDLNKLGRQHLTTMCDISSASTDETTCNQELSWTTTELHKHRDKLQIHSASSTNTNSPTVSKNLQKVANPNGQ